MSGHENNKRMLEVIGIVKVKLNGQSRVLKPYEGTYYLVSCVEPCPSIEQLERLAEIDPIIDSALNFYKKLRECTDVFGDALGRCCTEENFLSSAEKGVLRDYYLVRNPSNYGISLPSSEELPRYRGEIDVFDMILPSGEIDVHVFGPVEGEGVKLDGFVARILDH